jgi:anti-sigma B factor antagonist
MLGNANGRAAAPEPFEAHVEQEAGATFVRLSGELDLNCRRQFDSTMKRVASVRGQKIVIDLSGLTYVDSSGLRMILEAESISRRDGFDLSFIPGRGQVQRVLELTGVDSALSIFDERPTAESA